MSSDSDDEPLSAIAATKKANTLVEEYSDLGPTPKKIKKCKKKLKKTISVILPEDKLKHIILKQHEIQRPMDVWLYLKDLNVTGPYSCLLCPEWFINRSKLIIHYILNHKKDYCGICRYFVPDRDTWISHKRFHVPWKCSQCNKEFGTELELRSHFSEEHQLVHCRLCYFMLPDNDDYNSHLFQKHNVTNVSSKNEEVLWTTDYEGSLKFQCLLCSKSNNLALDFFKHFMCYHHFTLKCFTSLLSGNNVSFTIFGANVSTGFLASQLKEHVRYGYVDLEQKVIEPEPNTVGNEETNLNLDALIPEIKQEVLSETEEIKESHEDEATKKIKDDILKYKGVEDIDVTLTEIIIPQLPYHDYIESVIKAFETNTIYISSDIDYKLLKANSTIAINCPLCTSTYESYSEFVTHMCKMHCLKSESTFFCRVCTASFDSEVDYKNHSIEEMSEFDDLWLCQFCEKEFDNRASTREHLAQHFNDMETGNCFSPHLGFKCRYCPTLFWNEPDREMHQSETHYTKHKKDFYKCSLCDDIFSDKVWFTHHFWKVHKEEAKSVLYFLKCCICCVVLTSLEDMKVHFNIDHPEATKIFCNLNPCKFKPFSLQKSFRLHLKSMHVPKSKGSEGSLNCSVCGREFSNAKACGTHMSLAHGPGRFKCKFCSDTMQSSDERKLHYLLRHPGKHHFECVTCGKQFQYKSSLYMHRSDQHSPNKVTYTCSYCNKQFMKKDSYREHLQIHEGPRHACSYCPMRFVQRSNMLRHERRHTGERPYACRHCGRAFADKGACNSHTRTHTRTAFHTCIYCGQTFAQKSKLKYHIRKHTGENLETCQICAKLFTSACSLREHLKTHAEKVSVTCPMCEKKYSDEKSLIRHIRTAHNQDGLRSCPICSKAITTVLGLQRHVITHGQVKQFLCKCCSKSYALKKSMIKHVRKRHGFKGMDGAAKELYNMLDPRQCQIPLNEEVLTTIFGPPKVEANDVMVGDYVIFPKNNPIDNIKKEVDASGGEQDTDGEENDSETEDEQNHTALGNDVPNAEADEMDNEKELEPTSFVCFKTEPLTDSDSQD